MTQITNKRVYQSITSVITTPPFWYTGREAAGHVEDVAAAAVSNVSLSDTPHFLGILSMEVCAVSKW